MQKAGGGRTCSTEVLCACGMRAAAAPPSAPSGANAAAHHSTAAAAAASWQLSRASWHSAAGRPVASSTRQAIRCVAGCGSHHQAKPASAAPVPLSAAQDGRITSRQPRQRAFSVSPMAASTTSPLSACARWRAVHTRRNNKSGSVAEAYALISGRKRTHLSKQRVRAWPMACPFKYSGAAHSLEGVEEMSAFYKTKAAPDTNAERDPKSCFSSCLKWRLRDP
eukprot:76910-Prorocentrum_minimum.AAC.2